MAKLSKERSESNSSARFERFIKESTPKNGNDKNRVYLVSIKSIREISGQILFGANSLKKAEKLKSQTQKMPSGEIKSIKMCLRKLRELNAGKPPKPPDLMATGVESEDKFSGHSDKASKFLKIAIGIGILIGAGAISYVLIENAEDVKSIDLDVSDLFSFRADFD